MLTPDNRKLLRLPDVLARVPYSRSHLWRMEKQGNFPRRIALGPNRTVWLAAEIDQWMHERIAASRGEKPRQRGLM